MKPGLKATAFHEAGHAVAAWLVKIPIRKVTIVPKGDAAGYVLRRGVAFPKRVREILESGSRGTIRYIYAREYAWGQFIAERHAVYCLAGVEAQRRFNARSVRLYQYEGDRQSALDGLERIDGTDDLRLYWGLMQERARRLINEPSAWAAVKAIAAELMRRKTLSGDEARRVMIAATQAYFERRAANRR